MTGIEIGSLVFIGLIALLALRIHIGVAMLLAGSAGYVTLSGLDPLLNYFKSAAYTRFSVYDLSVVPLFLLMGQFATHGGLSKALFKAGNAMIGHWRGGMAMAAVTSCAGFGAICGSSLATAATMGQVALPQLKAHNYSSRLSTAVIAAGGIADAQGVRAAMNHGAAAVQVGTAFLLCHEAKTNALHRSRLRDMQAPTALTNLFSGGLARGMFNRVMIALLQAIETLAGAA